MKTGLTFLIAVCLSLSGFSQVISDYIFTSTTGAYTEISGGTSLGSETTDDQRFIDPAVPLGATTPLTGVGLPIGFSFNFNGQTFDRFGINANGWISLGSSSLTPSVDINSTSSYTPLSSTATNSPDYLRNRIAILGRDLAAQTGSTLMYLTTGTAPNRVLTIQWKNYRKYSNTGDVFNFQIKLYETTNVIELVYGTMTNNTTSTTCHVGLGGKNATEFHNRTSTTSWASSTKGGVNTDAMTLSSTVFPASGLIYRFTPSNCPSPSNLTAANMTTSTADLSWTSAGTLFNIQYGPSGFALGTGTIVNGHTTTSYQATGLTASTAYQYYVQNDCGSEQSGWSGPYTFYTLCDATTAPYSQNFDALTTPNMPNCWSTIVIGASGTPTITTVTTTPYSTPNCVRMYNSSSVGSSTHLLLISPQFSDLASGGKQVRFRAKMTGTGTPLIYVGTMSNPTNQTTFTSQQMFMDLTTDWKEYVVSFNSYTGSDQFIVIKHGLGTTEQQIFIDDFKWELIPTCPWPTAFTASNIQDVQGTFAWTEMGTATEWQIEYGAVGHTAGTGTIVPNVTTNPYTVTGLTGSTNYQVYVRAICGPGDTSAWTGPLAVTTTCSLATTFSENFNSVTTPALPNCWYKVGTTGSVTTQTSNPNSSPNCLYIYSSSTSNIAMVSMPPVSNAGANTHQLRFMARANLTVGGVLQLGYLTNPSDPATFVMIDQFTMPSLTYTEFTAYPNASVGTNTVFAFRHTGSPANSILIDDVYWEARPTCPKPTAINAAGIQDVQATIGWTENGSATEWQIDYGATGHAAGTGTIVSGVNTNPYTITGLTSQTAYSIYVRSVCGPGDTSLWAGPFNITTTCSLVSSFFENFDGVTASALPACWYKVGTTGSVYTQTTNPSSSPNCLYIYSSSTTSLGVLSMQPVNNAGANTHQIRFKARASGTTGGVLQVGYLTNPTDAATFTLLQSFTMTSATYTEFMVYPGASVGSNTTFAFRHSGSPTYSILIDDVYWEPKPACTPPTNLTATNVTTTSADLGWTSTGSETLWNIQYGPSGFTLGSGTILNGITDNPYSLTGINPSTIYQFYVQADCGTVQSTWAGPFAFTTLCATISTFPWTEGFESVVIPAFPPCWFKENGDWVTTNNANSTYDADARSGAQFLRESWSATNEYMWTPGFNVTAGQSYDFSFWWAGDGLSDWTGDIFRNSVQSSTGATQVGTSFVVSTTMTTLTYKQEKITYIPTTTGVVYFAIRVNCPSSTPWYLSFDDFRFELTPTCPRPSGLTAANVTQSTADVSWVAGGTESAWDIEYGPTGFAQGSGTLIENVTNPYTITGLTPSTTYQYYVLAQCSPTDSSYWEGPYSFTTLCGPTTATYIQNFDAVTVPALPTCWSSIVVGASGTPTITTVTTTPYSTPNCVRMYNATSVGSSTHLLLISPQFSDLSSGLNQVRFRAKMTGTGTPLLYVGTMSNPTNQTTFTSHQMIMTLTTSWQEFVVPFDTYTGSNQYIAIKHGLGTTEQQIFIDNFTWEPIPTCPWPTALTSSNIQDVQASFDWAEMGSATEWQLEYGTPAHTPGTGTIVSGITSKPYTVTGLTATTSYAFYVRAICGPGDTSAWTGPVNITTTCSLVSTFYENFDGVTTPALPTCWYKVGTTGSAYTQTSNPSTTPNCLYIYSSSTTSIATVSMPPVSNAGANTHQLRFKARGSSTANGVIQVGYLTNPSDPATFTLLQSFTITTLTYQEYVAYPGTSVGANTTFAFRHTGSPANSVLIDEVFWETKPSCSPPFNLSVSNVTSNSATLAWTSSGTETSWDVQYGITGFTLGTGTIVEYVTNPYNVTGLLPTTAYQYYVLAQCSLTDSSSWTGPYAFTTPCDAITTLPWTEGFEAVTIPAIPQCWYKENGDWITTNNANTTYDADAHTGTQFLRDAYSATNEFVWTPGFALTAGTSYDFKFWWAGDNYSGWAGDVFMNTAQASTGATQLGTSFVLATDVTTKTYQQEKYTFVPSSTGIYYFAIRINCTSSPWYISLDDFSLSITPQFDLAVEQMTNPTSGCGLSNAEEIIVSVTNYGAQGVTDPTFEYKVNNGSVVTEVYTGTINPLQTITYTFNATYDFSAAGLYTIKAWSVFASDTDASNDTLTKTITVKPLVNTYPYVDDMEGTVTYWNTGGTNNSWQWGVPAGTAITGAASGTKAWVTNLTGNYNNSEASYVESPCFDFSTIVNPVLTLNINVNSESSWDGACIQYSTNGGTTWQKLGAYNDQFNWYNDNSVYGLAYTGNEDGWANALVSGWNLAGHSLQNLVGQADVRFRVAFGSDASVNAYEGFGFDDFTITQLADLSAVAANGNLSGCNLDADTIRMYVKNVGAVTVASGESMDLKYIINALPAVTENYTLTASLAPGDSVLYTFNQPFTFNPGTFTVKLIVDYLSDMTSNNDTAQYTVNQQTLAVQIMGGDTMHINPAYLPYTLSLINLGYTYTTYEWSNYDGSITGSSATFNAPALGWYYVTVTNTNCTATDSILIDDLVGIGATSNTYGIRTYPNPATSRINIDIRLRGESDVIVELLTAEGKAIETRKYDNIRNLESDIDVSRYARGLYFIRITHDKVTFLDKISLE